MSNHFLIFDSEADAGAHVSMLGMSSAFDPTLPRCDSYKWNDPEVIRGNKCPASCPCDDRANPNVDCSYITAEASEARQINATGFAVKVTNAHSIIGFDVSGARVLTDLETTYGR